MKRPVPLLNDHCYHVYNKSIYGYAIFNSPTEYQRMLHICDYYRFHQTVSYSLFLRRNIQQESTIQLVKIHAYCIMPTHIHFLLEQLTAKGIQTFMRNIQSSYTLYFNMRHKRQGPLWQNRFCNKIINNTLSFETVVQYIHNNPVKDLGYKTPKDWPYSSANL